MVAGNLVAICVTQKTLSMNLLQITLDHVVHHDQCSGRPTDLEARGAQGKMWSEGEGRVIHKGECLWVVYKRYGGALVKMVVETL